MVQCARKLLDAADIVREAIFTSIELNLIGLLFGRV
jgi:hypothetical protein